MTLTVALDPQLHTHVAIPNVVLTEDGRVAGSICSASVAGCMSSAHTNQAHVATDLHRHREEVELDEATGASRLTAIPDHVRDAFSKRTCNGTDPAPAYADKIGLDWDTLDDAGKIGLAKQGV